MTDRVPQAALTPEQQALIRSSTVVPRLARQMAKRSSTLNYDELVSIGNESEVRAVLRFDASRGVPFEAFAFSCVRLDMKRAIIDEGKRQARERTGLLGPAYEYLEQARDPGDLFTDTRDDAGRHLSQFLSGILAVVSLCSTGEASHSVSENDIAAHVDRERRRALMHEHLTALGDKGRLLTLRYVDGLDWDAVAEAMGVSLATAGRLHVTAIELLSARVMGATRR
jgi:RNA polymerase sigma factor (sigma-70 family)